MKGIGRAAKTQNSSNKKEKTRQKIRKIRAIEKRCCYPVSPGCGGGDFTERRVEGEISALGSDHATCCRSPDGIRLWGRRAYTISINYFILLSMQWMVYFPFSTNSIDMFSWAKKWMNSLEKAPGPLVLFYPWIHLWWQLLDVYHLSERALCWCCATFLSSSWGKLFDLPQLVLVAVVTESSTEC